MGSPITGISSQNSNIRTFDEEVPKIRDNVTNVNQDDYMKEIALLKLENEELKKMVSIDANEELNVKTKLNLENQKIQDEISVKQNELDILNGKVIELDDIVELESFGIYKPKFNFMTSEEYSNKLKDIREKQKQMIKDDRAVKLDNNFTLNGSQKEGQKMLKDTAKLFLRSFNVECDLAMIKTTFSNVDNMIKRISQNFESINKQGKLTGISMSEDYLELKKQELYISYEYAVKKQEEKEEQRAAKEQMREEAKLLKELENARKEIEKENTHYTKAYENVVEQLKNSTNEEEKEILEQKVLELQSKLDEIQEKFKDVENKEANKRAGYVYVISNIGSFGENVFKIGMTRRLEPMDRVDELGDASVPFRFDVHAMIFSDDAPTLENAIHKAFDSKKVNMVNTRREFFNVSLEQIENVVKQNFDKSVEFTKIPVAEEYRESIKIKESLR